MFNKYLEFLRSCLEQFSAEGKQVTFLDYLEAIGLTLMLIATILCTFTVLLGVFCLPVVYYRHKVKKLRADIAEAFKNHSDKSMSNSEIKKPCNKLRTFQVVYAIGLVVVYIPIAIPTLLFLASLVLHV